MFGLILDDVEIGQGTYVGTPDLAINDILLPASACGLSSQTPVQVLVSNKGQADIVKLGLAYSLDGANPVREEFGTLPASKDTTFVFSQTMDLSVLGKHKIQIEAEVLVSAGKEESNLDNNAAIDSVISFSPAHVPSITDFSMSEQAENWVGDWKWDASTGGYVTMDYKPLFELTDYDVRLCSFDLPLARLMPLEHLDTSLNATVEVQNRGLKLSDVLVEIMQGTQVVGSSTATLAGLDDVIAVPVEFALSGLSVGDMPVLTARATLVGHADADLTRDNEKQFAMTVTQDEMAYDNVTDTMFANPSTYAVGSSAALAIGLPFRLSVRDTLTGISIGWGNPKNEEVELSIHRWNAATRTLGEKVYEGTVSAGTESRFVRYQLSGLLLEAGDYMISEKASGYILMTDMSAEGRLYVTSSDPVHLQQDVGYPAIRAIFGSDAVLTAKDVAVEEFVKPRGNGLFSANQKVEVKVRNLGYDEVTVPVTLRVNKAEPVTRTVKLAAYESGIAAFTADMSMPSTDYVLTAIACMEGDSDHINDTLVKMFRSVAPADPYRMDFEACQDWASEDFNPAWTTVDADGAPLGGWSQFSYPLLRQTAVFLVFNPSLTEPSLLDALPEYAAAHGGERYGASIYSYQGVANNDWLISPKLRLPEEGAKMEFYVKSFSSDYGLESYNIYVSATDNNLASFEKIGQTRQAPDAWTLVQVDLGGYAGKDVYVAIQCVSQDIFMFMVDDIVVSKPAGNETGFRVDADLSLYPNPASEMIRILSARARIERVSIVNLSGRLVYESPDGLDRSEFRYDVSGLASGLYFARVKTNQGVAVLKFVIR